MKTKRKEQPKNLKQTILILVLLPVLVASFALFFKLDYFFTTLFYFGLPALYLSLHDRQKIKRNLIFSSLFTLSSAYADYIAEKSLAWYEPSSIFKFRIGGIVPLEAILWFFLLSYLVIAFYEHFFDRVAHKTVGRHMKILISLAVIGTAVFIVQLLTHEQPTINYFYLKFGLVLGLIPLAAFLLNFPRFISVFLKSAPYFLGLSILNEFLGLHNKHWLFPGHEFIGWLGVDKYQVPDEEVIFWMVLFSSIVIAYFELFDDNRLKFKPIRFRLR